MHDEWYLYTNPPPYGHGSHTPYVAETVIRAYDYNRKHASESNSVVNGHKILDVQIPDV